ncbi:ImmA/IrrE family metallo-endopeptidase [Corynebacterium poyangense]|nr:ImmA/IrrE family metallo-endopeptidase [Corynebacterium poyangense]
MSTDDLFALAESMGLKIEWHSGRASGYYHHHEGVISLREGLTDPMLRCTLAHEIAHAIRGDNPCDTEWANRRMERAADLLAASLLISVEDYAQAEILHGPTPAAIAQELGVTRHILETWQTSHRNFQVQNY